MKSGNKLVLSVSNTDSTIDSTMAPPKQPYETEEAARASNNSLIKQFFTSNKRGRPKKGDGENTVITKKRKPGPVPQSKKPPPKPAPSEANKRALEEVPEVYKVKKRRTNWGKGAAKSSGTGSTTT